MELLARSKSVIALGKRIVASLSQDEDLTSEWMAHLIAERINAVEKAQPEDRAEAEEACVQEILRLWEHRYKAPARFNPLREIEPIARSLAALDPEREEFRYYSEALGLAREEDCKNPSDWLKLALQINHTSKDLIRFSLQQGGREAFATPEFKGAFDEAIGANVDLDVEIRLARFIAENDDLEELLAQAAEKSTREKIAQLERFAALSMQMAEKLKQSLP
ncbi:TPA: hypothetical protein ACQTXI_003037 [Pseudomonas aeruginosa]